VKFSIDQRVDVTPEVAAAAYATPAFFEGRAPRENISVLGVPQRTQSGDVVTMEVAFQFTGSISGAVRAIIDPAKMTWITHHRIDLGQLRSEWTIVPDHYPDRLTGRGSYTFTADGIGTIVRLEGELKVHVLLVGRTVEQVIVSGLRKYFAGEVASIPDVPPV
jgi:hypothetical protein